MAREIIDLELPTGEVVELDIDSSWTDEVIREKAVAAGLFDPAPVPRNDADDMPAFDEESRPVRKAPKKERTVSEIAKGVGETAVGFGTALTGGAVGFMGGALGEAVEQTMKGQIGTQAAVDAIADAALEGAQALTFAPRTETGQEFMKDAGEFLEQAVPPVVPMGIEIAAATRVATTAKLKPWVNERLYSEKPVTADEAAKVTGLSMEQAERMADTMNQIGAKAKVDAATIDLVHNPKTAMSITDGPKGKRTLSKQEKEVRAEIRKAFAEDGDMADHLTRTANEAVATRELELKRLDLERQFGVDAGNPQMREAFERAYADAKQDVPTPHQSLDMVRANELKARQEAMLARIEAENLNKVNNSHVQAKENRQRRAAQSTGFVRNEDTIRGASGKIRWTQILGQKLVKRVEQISPRLATALRKSEVVSTRRSNARIEQLMPWLGNKAITRAVKKSPTFRSALLNVDRVKMDRIVPGSSRIFDEAVAPVLQHMNVVRKENGMKVLDDMWPRAVNSVDKVRKVMGRKERDKLEVMEADEVARNGGHALNEEQRAGLIGQLIGGRPVRQDKSRRVLEVTEAAERHYVNPRSSLIDAVHKFEEDLANQEFMKNTLGSDIKLQDAVTQDHVTGLLSKAIEAGDLSHRDVRELAELLSTHFGAGRASPHAAVRGIKGGITLMTLGLNPKATLTQLGDLFISSARFGVSEAFKGLGKNADIPANAYNAAVRQMAAEVRTPTKLGMAIRKGLEAFGFAQLDRKFADASTKAAYNVRVKQLTKTPNKLRAELVKLFGDDADQVVKDLGAKRMTDDVATLIAHDVADIRPLGRLDMPLSYSKSPNGRLAYSLLSWSLNQMNYVRNNAVHVMERGVKLNNPAMVAKGAKTLATMTLLFAVGGGAAGTLKDLLSGKDVTADSVGMHMAGAAIPFGLMGKFAFENIASGRGSSMSVIPAVSLIDQAFTGVARFIKTGEVSHIMKATPMGRNLYDLAVGTDFISDAEANAHATLGPQLGMQERMALAAEQDELRTQVTGARQLPDETTPEQRAAMAPKVTVPQAVKDTASVPRNEAAQFKAAKELLEVREGRKAKVYQLLLDDGKGGKKLDEPTVGIGHVLSETERQQYKVGDTVPQEKIDAWFKADSAKAFNAARKQAKAIGRPDMVPVLASVNFQLGTNWTTKHPSTWEFMKQRDWTSAAAEAADSLWFVQTPDRVQDLQVALLQGIEG